MLTMMVISLRLKEFTDPNADHDGNIAQTAQC